jgi:hypothetical protein
MKLTVVLTVLIGILIVGCSSGEPAPAEPKPNIEATVAARVESIVVSLPTMTPYPTYTPAPLPTQTPKPIPTVTPIPLPPPVFFAPMEGWDSPDKNGISHDSIGTPIMKIAYMNASNKTLDAIEFRICPKNRFGETLLQFGFGDACIIGVTDKVIIPFVDATNKIRPWIKVNEEGKNVFIDSGLPNNLAPESEKGELSDYIPFTTEKYFDMLVNTSDPNPGMWGEWTLHGFETTVQAEIELVRVHFQDGTVWTENGN